ncbi:hypothetical protein VTI28DRAFT_7782 [Corynascus sepedonium]
MGYYDEDAPRLAFQWQGFGQEAQSSASETSSPYPGRPSSRSLRASEAQVMSGLNRIMSSLDAIIKVY